ncbi:hypothetical protein GobsT_11650 [Gemmata obscuriglobus]|uniref:Uncharacterized protein n=1 Tax=Gemmata obscuriglobus TaxID=114 RepID=A0A2Z3HF20_9BACT|nr:hypothetical protein [Gemmata obscuriglobus]AWM40354.1 hypothetical protein C1280_27365 [Gemmata obscuriglobus]QEG26426.1 hypothetical protein GobsT_11650 [Gemmata obscuriglobus]VTS01567.1 unnamed protein product [Gemmata obscuriglobus UQM 2246]
MTRTRFGLLVVAASALAAGRGAVAARWPNRREEPAPEPEHASPSADPTRPDFGEVWETDRFPWARHARNRTPVSATVFGSEWRVAR